MKRFTKDFKKMNINDGKDKGKKNKMKKNEENKIEEPKKELTEEEKFKEELIDLKEKLREIKIFFDQNKPKKYNEDKIENYILFENLVKYDKIKQKIIDIFKNEDIYSILFELWKKIIDFSKNKNKDNIEETNEENESSEDENEKNKKPKRRNLIYAFNKLLMNLSIFTPKVINNTKDKEFKEQICESIFTNIQLITDIEDGQFFLYYFTEVFGTKEIFKEKLIKEHKEQMTNIIFGYLVFGINFINIFDLQEMFPLEQIFKVISDNLYLISYHIYSLLSETYIKNDPNKKYLILDNIFKLLKEDKNIAQFNLAYELINKDFIEDAKRNDIIKEFLALIRINIEKSININTLVNAIYYCKIILENNKLFSEDQIIQTKKYICSYFNKLKIKDWRVNLSKLNLLNYKDVKGYLDTSNLKEYYYELPLTKIESFEKILKFLPDEIDDLLKQYDKKRNHNDGIKLIKKLKLTDEEIPLIFKIERMKQFFHYKINTCYEENNPHNLIDYCLISQQTLDASILKILNKYYNGKKYDYFYLYVINEIYYDSNEKGLKLSKKVRKEIEDIYYKLDYKDKYSFKDYFGPVTKDCIQIDQKKTKVYFIDDIKFLDETLNKYFVNTEYVGIDSEWQQNFKIIDDTKVSIIQICNYEENCCILLDMLELSQKEKFFEIFEKYFKGKIFIGFYFDKSDLEVFPLRLRNFFENKENCTIYDVFTIAQQKLLEKGNSLKLLTEKIFGKSLCKYEQCSDWNLRPLTQCQKHYAALDALICIMLFKKLMEN